MLFYIYKVKGNFDFLVMLFKLFVGFIVFLRCTSKIFCLLSRNQLLFFPHQIQTHILFAFQSYSLRCKHALSVTFALVFFLGFCI